jgi:hypothetical protein
MNEQAHMKIAQSWATNKLHCDIIKVKLNWTNVFYGFRCLTLFICSIVHVLLIE